MTERPARLLVIAGSDSSGGAGIQADIKTATAFGVYAMTAVTAVTVQDTRGVHIIHPIPASIVRDQIACVLDDIGADAIKIGMLGSAEIVTAVAATLEHVAQGIPLVLDPVMLSTSGAHLLNDDAIQILKHRLLPNSTLVTPNLPEAARLTGFPVRSGEAVLRAAECLCSMGAKAVLIKGGHTTGTTVDDLLLWEGGNEMFAYPRIETRHTHGTGCTLATAIACGLAQNLSTPLAVARAREFLQEAIATAPGFGHGHGPLNHMVREPQP